MFLQPAAVRIGEKTPNWTKCNMRIFKIAVAIILLVAFALTLISCTDNNNSSNRENQTSATDSVESKVTDSTTDFDGSADTSGSVTKSESETTTVHKGTEGNTTKSSESASTNTTAPKKDATSSDENVSDNITQKTETSVAENSTSESYGSSTETTDSNAPIELEEIDF